mgnify:CR=1 FL=1
MFYMMLKIFIYATLYLSSSILITRQSTFVFKYIFDPVWHGMNVSGEFPSMHVEDVCVVESWMSGVDLCRPRCPEYSTNKFSMQFKSGKLSGHSSL